MFRDSIPRCARYPKSIAADVGLGRGNSEGAAASLALSSALPELSREPAVSLSVEPGAPGGGKAGSAPQANKQSKKQCTVKHTAIA